jgi:MerR family redox-sensitive transcriptional activator SoxR
MSRYEKTVRLRIPRKIEIAEGRTPFQNSTLKIGELAKRSGIPVVTLRFYEIEKLIRPVKTAENRHSTHRRFLPSVLNELEFIKSCRAAGFSIPEIKSVIKLYRGFKTPAQGKMTAVRRTLEMVRERKRRLEAIERIFLKRLREPEVPVDDLF